MAGTQACKVIHPLLLVLDFPEHYEILENHLHWTTRNFLVSTVKIVGCMAQFGCRGRRGGGNTIPIQGGMNTGLPR